MSWPQEETGAFGIYDDAGYYLLTKEGVVIWFITANYPRCRRSKPYADMNACIQAWSNLRNVAGNRLEAGYSPGNDRVFYVNAAPSLRKNSKAKAKKKTKKQK